VIGAWSGGFLVVWLIPENYSYVMPDGDGVNRLRKVNQTADRRTLCNAPPYWSRLQNAPFKNSLFFRQLPVY